MHNGSQTKYQVAYVAITYDYLMDEIMGRILNN